MSATESQVLARARVRGAGHLLGQARDTVVRARELLSTVNGAAYEYDLLLALVDQVEAHQRTLLELERSETITLERSP